jgi:hypothetical protein
MKKNYEALSGINLDMFYSVRITPTEISLQGRQSSETIISIRLNYMKSYEDFHINDDGYVEGNFVRDGITFRVCLT